MMEDEFSIICVSVPVVFAVWLESFEEVDDWWGLLGEGT